MVSQTLATVNADSSTRYDFDSVVTYDDNDVEQISVAITERRGYSGETPVVSMALHEAIELAKRILALQEQAEDAELERRFAEMEEQHDATLFNWDCVIEPDYSIEDDYDWIRTGC